MSADLSELKHCFEEGWDKIPPQQHESLIKSHRKLLLLLFITVVLQALAHWVFLVFHRIAESCENFSFHMPESAIPKVGAICKHSILAPVCALGSGTFPSELFMRKR